MKTIYAKNKIYHIEISKKLTTKINTRILFDLVINIHENNTLNNQLQNVTLGTAMFSTE